MKMTREDVGRRVEALFVACVIVGLASQARAGSLAVNGNLTAPSLNVGTDITATNQTSIGAAGNVTTSIIGDPTTFGISLNSSNALPRIDFTGPGSDGGGFHFYSKNQGYLGCLWVASEDGWLHCNLPGFSEDGTPFNVGTISTYELNVWDTAVIGSKLTLYGTTDPPVLLLDAQTRATVAQRVSHDVPPSKQTGAALFWNSSTKRLEVYVAADGAFYDLAGNVLANITAPAVAGATVTTTYHVDTVTGQVVADDSLHAPRWQLKAGYQFDKTTGTFTQQASSNAPPVAATSSQALELR
jgi:hypothetical protein